MNLRKYQCILCLLLCIGVFSNSLAAVEPPLWAENSSTIDDAVNAIRAQTGGRILSADTVVVEGKAMHKIKVLMPNGHVKTFFQEISND